MDASSAGRQGRAPSPNRIHRESTLTAPALRLWTALAGGLAACGGSTRRLVHTASATAAERHRRPPRRRPRPPRPATPATADDRDDDHRRRIAACVAGDAVAVVPRRAGRHGPRRARLRAAATPARRVQHLRLSRASSSWTQRAAALPTTPTTRRTTSSAARRSATLTVAPGAGGLVPARGHPRGRLERRVCTTAYGLQVIPPNDTATLRVRSRAAATNADVDRLAAAAGELRLPLIAAGAAAMRRAAP